MGESRLTGRALKTPPVAGVVGFVPGVWDMFHIGHLNLLQRARLHCDHLIAGVLIDELVVEGKGRPPVMPWAERVEILASLRLVDTAVRDDSLDKLALWDRLRFDVLFKGDDWQGTPKGDRMGRDAARLGVRVQYFPYTPHTSSTHLRQVLNERNAELGGRRFQTYQHASVIAED